MQNLNRRIGRNGRKVASPYPNQKIAKEEKKMKK